MKKWLTDTQHMTAHPFVGRTKTLMQVQRTLALFFAPLTYLLVSGWMIYFRRYHVEELHQVRERFRKITSESRTPWVICANHLTLIDSMVLLWALSSVRQYVARPYLFSWNLPEKTNFYHNYASRLLCYLGKCIPVIRGGSMANTAETREKIQYVLRSKEAIMIFPEGTRSRTGKIDLGNPSYAVGDILRLAPEARVLCIYMRGKNQKTYGNFPITGETFNLKMETFNPTTSSTGLRAQKDLSMQILSKLKQMENQYFECAHHAR